MRSSNITNSNSQPIEFDLKINDYNRLLVVCRNVLESKENKQNEFECSLYSESECHHKHGDFAVNTANKRHPSPDGSQKCTFCRFYDLLDERATSIRINPDIYKTSSTNAPHFVQMRFKKSKYPVGNILDWCEFQPWRSPYGLVAYACCSSQAEVLEALRAFEAEKERLKKSLIASKLFIDMHMKHEMSEEYCNSLVDDKSMSSLSSVHSVRSSGFDSMTSDTESIFSTDTLTSVATTSAFQDPLSSGGEEHRVENNSDLDPTVERSQRSQPSVNLSTSSSSGVTNSSFAMIDKQPVVLTKQEETELSTRLKHLEKDIVHLDFLFVEKGVDKIAVIVETEKTKVDQALREMANSIFKKLYTLIKGMSTSEDKQLNYYSELLRTPSERATSESSMLTNTSMLSIKVINKKMVISRMNKFKADIYLLLNLVDSALINYSNSYSQAKKEPDNSVWTISALEGLCAASFIYLTDTRQLSNGGGVGNSGDTASGSTTGAFSLGAATASSSTISRPSLLGRASQADLSQSLNQYMEASTRKQAFIELKSTLKRTFSASLSKDLVQIVIPVTEFPKNYQLIVNTYYKSESTKFISLEVSFMIIKFLLEYNYRAEAISFITYAVYISNLPIREEAKIRRYLEIGNLYERCEMRHLSTFYKWVSAGRIFKLIEAATATKSSGFKQNAHFKCLLNKCRQQMIDLFPDMKIEPQEPFSNTLINANSTYLNSTRLGFPFAKKHIVIQIVQLLQYEQNYLESIKFVKYMLHEMTDFLNNEETKFYSDFLISLLGKVDQSHIDVNDPFFTKFYKFPLISSFRIIVPKQEFNRTTQIKAQLESQPSGIYIHRYENPLLNKKKAVVYNLPVSQVNKIEIAFSNPLSIDLSIEQMNLIGELKTLAKYDIGLGEDSNSLSEEKRQFHISLFGETSNGPNLVKIPARSKCYRVQLGFLYETLDELKLVGYELRSSLKMTHEIMFTEISSQRNESSSSSSINGSSSRLASLMNSNGAGSSGSNGKSSNDLVPVQASYEIKMIPKLPVIKSLELFACDHNQNRQCVSQFVNSKFILVTSKLGICETHEFEVNLEEACVDLEILELRLLGQNDQQAQKLGASISIVSIPKTTKDSETIGHQKNRPTSYALKIDSCNFTSNNLLEESELDITTYVEIKYTNKMGSDRNQCNVFKSQLVIRFAQIVYFSLRDLVDVDARNFEIVLSVRNLSKSPIVLKQSGNESVIEENAELESRVAMRKLELNGSDVDLNAAINANLDLKYAQQGSDSFSALKFNNQSQQFRNYSAKIFSCPIDLAVRRSVSSSNSHGPKLYSLMLIARNSLKPDWISAQSANFYFIISWKIDNLNYSIVSKDKDWILKDFESKFWANEMKIVTNEQTNNVEDLMRFCIQLKECKNDDEGETSISSDSSELMKWYFNYKFSSNEFSYFPN